MIVHELNFFKVYAKINKIEKNQHNIGANMNNIGANIERINHLEKDMHEFLKTQPLTELKGLTHNS